MNNPELDKLLSQAKSPEPPDSYWDELPLRVKCQLGRASAEQMNRKRLFPRLAWGVIAAAFCCLIIALVLGRWSSRTRSDSPEMPLANAKVIGEMMALFPNRVRAISWDEHGLRLVLSEKADVPNSPPVFVEVSDGKTSSAWVTFSGQELPIAKDKVEVLVDAQGQVMLVGDRLFWTKGQAVLTPGHLRIQACLLASNGKEAQG